MQTLLANTADELYHEILNWVYQAGNITHPRDFECLEISPCATVLTNPYANIITNPERKINRGFAAAELMWMLSGRNDVEFIAKYNSKIANYSDDGKTFFGAYGPWISSQFQYIFDTLSKDPWSRQAVMTIWRQNPPTTKDVPCTVMMHFIRRPLNRLNLYIYMRSQDIWLGFPYDLHNFTCIQIIMAEMLGINAGLFELIQGSLHMYKPDLEKILKAKEIKSVSENTPHDIPRLVAQKLGWMNEYLSRKVSK
jgi:thymidylate synthase